MQEDKTIVHEKGMELTIMSEVSATVVVTKDKYQVPHKKQGQREMKDNEDSTVYLPVENRQDQS